MYARSSRSKTISYFWPSLFATALLGCGQAPEISSYDVPRDAPATANEADANDITNSRMIAAIVPRDSEAWFVKVVAPEEQVAMVADDVRTFVESLQLSNGDPNKVEWSVPEAWSDVGARPMREATLLLPAGDETVELAISKLSFDGDQQPYLLANINRWRGQLGLAPVEQVGEEADVSTVALDGGTAWLFDAVGKLNAGSMRPPMMGLGPPVASSQSPTPPVHSPGAGANSRTVLRVRTPEDWKELPRGSMGSRNFALGTGGDAVEIKLSDFPPVGMMADPLTNINRWRGQLELAPIEEDALAENTEGVKIGDSEGVLAEITSPDESRTMLAAMVEQLGQVWFFQMTGSPSAISAHRDQFVDWLATVRITPPEGGL